MSNGQMSLHELLQHEREFSTAAFGPNRSFVGPLMHLKKEIDEVFDEAGKDVVDEHNGSLIEFADCLLLLLDAFRLRHPDLTGDDLIRVAYNKIQINKKRKWGKPDENGVFEHDRSE